MDPGNGWKKMLKRMAAIAIGTTGIAFAHATSGMAVSVLGPTSITGGSLTLELRATEGLEKLEALSVVIDGPDEVFDKTFGLPKAKLQLSPGEEALLPDTWLFFPISGGKTAAIAGFGPLVDIPDAGGTLMWLTFPILSGAPAGSTDLSFSVEFNTGTFAFADYRVTINAVPEPGSLALVLAGLAFVALSRRRR